MSRRRLRCAALGGLIVVILIGLSATTTFAQGAAPPVSRTEAERVVAEFDQANTKNNATLDVEGQDAIEDPPLRTIDDAFFHEHQGRGQSSLDTSEQVQLEKVSVAVPDQSGYPLRFLATAQYTSNGTSTTQLLAFSRASEGAPWKVAMAVGLADGASVPRLATSRDGLVRLLDADHAASLKIKPTRLPRALADVWARSAGQERRPSLAFAPGPFTTRAADQFVMELGQSGIDGKVDFRFAPADFPVVAYRTGNGGGLCLFALELHETITPTGSQGLVQPQSREVFGGLVEPGQFGEVRYDRLAIVAAAVPKGGTKKQVHVLGLYEGPVEATALPPGATATA